MINARVHVDPLHTAIIAQEHDLQVFHILTRCTVKLIMTDDVGSWHGSGFFFSDQPMIATVRHLLEFNGRRPTKIIASYPDLAPDEIVQELKVSEVDDIAVLKGTHPPPSFMSADAIGPGSTVYITGFSSSTAKRPARSKGQVSLGLEVLTVTAHADHGWSGGPCADIRGCMVGMVKGPHGPHSPGGLPTVELVPALSMQNFLRASQLPPLLAV